MVEVTYNSVHGQRNQRIKGVVAEELIRIYDTYNRDSISSRALQIEIDSMTTKIIKELNK